MLDNISIEEYYDIIIIGTDIKEVILFGLLSNTKIEGNKAKVILLSENKIYGGNNIGLTYNEIQKYKNESNDTKIKKDDIITTDYDIDSLLHIDLIFKIFFANDALYKHIQQMELFQYLTFKPIENSFIIKTEGSIFGKTKYLLHKVPTTISNLSTISGKINKFIKNISNTNEMENNNELNDKFNVTVKNHKIDTITEKIIGKCLNFYSNDNYLEANTSEIVQNILTYYKYNEQNVQKTPLFYPSEGMGALIEFFSVLGVYNKGIIKNNINIKSIEFNSENKFSHIKINNDKIIKGKYAIIEPSIAFKMGLNDNVKEVQKEIYKSFCIIDKTMFKLKYNNSCIITIPNKVNDFFLAIVGQCNDVIKNGHYLSIFSALLEKNEAIEEKGIIKHLNEIIGEPAEKYSLRIPCFISNNTIKNNIFVTSTLDHSPYLNNDLKEIENIYNCITNNKLFSY